MIVLKFSDIRLEGDIVASLKCLTRYKIINEDKSIIQKFISSFLLTKFISLLKRLLYPLANYFTSNLQISLHNTSLMQLGNQNKNSVFNDCLMHSTIQLIQFEFATKSKRQINFQVDGFSIKILKSSHVVEGDGMACLAQMSFPFRFNYTIDDKSADISISSMEVIVYDILLSFWKDTDQIEVSNISKFDLFHVMLQFLKQKIFKENVIKGVKFNLISGSIKLVREYGKKELTFFVKPIELVLIKSDSNILESRISIVNFSIQDSESIINFSLNKCCTICKLEEENSEKLYLQLFFEVSNCSFVINYYLVNFWFQYFLNLFRNINTAKQLTENETSSIHELTSKFFSKIVFAMIVNDVSVSLNQTKNLMITYGLKNLKITCVRNFDFDFSEKR